MAVDYKLEGETWANPGDITWSFATTNFFGQPGVDDNGNSIFQPVPLTGIFKQDVINAFAAWSAVANVHFVQVADSSNVDIRIGWENIDGPGNVLGETYYDYDQNDHFTEADIGFDHRDPWAVSGSDEKAEGAPFFIVALHEIGHALGLDHYNAQPAVMNAFIDSSLTSLTIHDINGIVALYGPADHAPVVTVANKSLVHGAMVAVSTLFSVSDFENEPITEYNFKDLSASASSGYFVLSGVVQAANTTIDIFAADLVNLTFVAGATGSDQLQVSASDGMHFSSVRTFTVTATDHAPVVTATNLTATHGQVFTAAELFSVSDADADAIVSYQIYDATTSSTSGHWDISGVDQAAGKTITVAPADLANLTFESGSGADLLQVRAYDGIVWGAWDVFRVTAPADHAPVVTAANLVATHAQIFTAAELFSVSDADGDAIVSYQIYDATTSSTSGHWDISGVDQAAAKVITVAPADLANLTFESGSGADLLQVRAFDGYVWGAWDVFRVTAPVDHAPVVTAANLTATHGQVFTAAELFSVSDADADAILSYQIYDATTSSSSGHWDISGVDQAAAKVITVAPADLANLTFESGSGADLLQVRAFDGYVWGAWDVFRVTAPADHAPVIAAANLTATHGQVFTAAELFSVSDADADAILSYQIYDATTSSSSGHWDISGVDQAAAKVITVAPADLANLTFESGSGADLLQVRAFDGELWGAWDVFRVTAPVDHAPVIAATNLTATHGQVFTAAELFSVSDADADAIVSYQITDNTTSSSSGHWNISGVDQVAGKTITVAAADLANLTFESGSGNDSLSVRAFDGDLWSAAKTFTVAAPVDHAPVVAGGTASVALNSHTLASDLFSASDADAGDVITQFQLLDTSPSAASGHWEVNGVAQAANHTITVAAADLMTVDFVGGAAPATDHLEVRAYDDMVWGGWHDFNVVTHA